MSKIHWLETIGLVFLGTLVGILLTIFGGQKKFELLSPGGGLVEKDQPKPLEEFSFESLAQKKYLPSAINLEKLLEENPKFFSYLLSYLSDGKKVSGLAHIPKKASEKNKLPVIVMLRGYVDQQNYQTGMGTKRAGEVLAENGFITLAPDFLGFGQSDNPKNDVFWERFNRPVQVLNLLASIKTLPQADEEKIGIWAHSNGGQIALSVLEISQKNYPTTLWAPVSKSFPYSILFYTDEFDDQGKLMRQKIADLEKDYDLDKFSITNYFDQIKAPIQLHQGLNDQAVPYWWSDSLAEKLKSLKIKINYYQYPGADHNMLGSWQKVVNRDLAFFKEKFH